MLLEISQESKCKVVDIFLCYSATVIIYKLVTLSTSEKHGTKERDWVWRLTGKCNVRWVCDPSSHWFGQGRLDLISPNFPPAITFLVDHFPSAVYVCALGWMSVSRDRKKARVVCFQGQCICGGCRALEIVGSPVCNLILVVLPLEVKSIWFSALTDWLCWCVCLHCRRLNTYKAPLRQPVAFQLRHHGSVWLSEEWSQLDMWSHLRWHLKKRKLVQAKPISTGALLLSSKIIQRHICHMHTNGAQCWNSISFILHWLTTPKSKHQSPCWWMLKEEARKQMRCLESET